MITKPKFLVDVGVGNIMEDWLEQQEFDVQTVRRLNPKMTDIDILNLASKEKRIVITMDKDFGELIFASKKKHAGVLLLRLDDAASDQKLTVVKEIFTKHLKQLANHFCVYQNETLRIR